MVVIIYACKSAENRQKQTFDGETLFIQGLVNAFTVHSEIELSICKVFVRICNTKIGALQDPFVRICDTKIGALQDPFVRLCSTTITALQNPFVCICNTKNKGTEIPFSL